jgi:MFS family permease
MVFTQRVAHPPVQGSAPTQPRQQTAVGRGTIEAPNWLVVTVVALCGTVVTLQQTLVVTVLPDFPQLLNTSAENASWLVTSTLLTGAVSTPIVGRLADMFGKRKLMLVCLATLLAGSVVAGVSGSLGLLVIGRSLQGVGAALIPVGISILRDVLPPERINVAVALMGATLGLGGAVGLLISGTIYQTLGWHSLFWLAAAMAVILLVAVRLLVPESLVRTGGRFDYLGAILLSVAVSALLLAISKSGSWGWTSGPTIASFLVAIVVLVIWVPYQRRINDPLVDIRTTTERPVLLANSATFLVGIAMFANLLVTVQLLQIPPVAGYGFGLTSTQAGLAMAPSGLATIAMAPVAATIIGRLGPKVTLIAGTLVMAGGYGGLIFGMDSLSLVLVSSTVAAMGGSIASAAIPILIMRSVPITETASANGVNGLVRSIGMAIASAAAAALLTASTIAVGPLLLPTASAFESVLWLAAGVSVVAALIGLPLPGRHAPVAARPAGARLEQVVRGVVRATGGPAPRAVVAVIRPDGEQIDWSRAEPDGGYALALPGAGRYVAVTSADGWAPQSELFDHTGAATVHDIVLQRPLTLHGQIRSTDEVGDAMVALTRPTGEVIATTRTDPTGAYTLPLPPVGQYVITAVDAAAQQCLSRSVTVTGQSMNIDIEPGAPAVRHVKL